MLNVILSKRAHILTLIIILSVLVIATTAFGVTKLIKAKDGGVIRIAPGVSLRVPAGALEKNTEISATMRVRDRGVNFRFGPSGTTFDPPARRGADRKRMVRSAPDPSGPTEDSTSGGGSGCGEHSGRGRPDRAQ